MEVVAMFEECPWCKVDARLMQSIVDEEVGKGNMSKGATGATKFEVYVNMNPLNPPIIGARLPAARRTVDVCMKCGREYTVRIEKGHAVPPSRPGEMPAFV